MCNRAVAAAAAADVLNSKTLTSTQQMRYTMRSRGFGRKRNQVVSSAVVPESQSAPVPAAGALAPPLAAVDNADIEVDSESDDDLMAEVADQVAEERSVTEVMLNATATRITPVTRKLYDSHMRQMAVWCMSVERFRQCVGADGNMIVPLDSDAMIMFTEHLLQKQVPWVHAQVPGTMKHLAVKTVSNFFAAAGFMFAMRNEKLPPAVAQYFSNTKKSYTLKIGRLKDAGLHPDSTNSTGINFSVYERICTKLGGYVAHFKGSCYSCWRDLWLFWVLLFNLLGRCFQVSKICYEMIWWQDDALVIKVPSQKGAYTTSAIHHTPPYTTIHHLTPPYTQSPTAMAPLIHHLTTIHHHATHHTPPHCAKQNFRRPRRSDVVLETSPCQSFQTVVLSSIGPWSAYSVH